MNQPEQTALDGSQRVSLKTTGTGDQTVQYFDVGKEGGKQTILAPGYAETPISFQLAIDALRNNTGRRVYTVCNHHGIDVPNEINVPKAQSPLYRKVAAVQSMAEDAKLSRVDGIGHSAGSGTLALAAERNPNLLRNIALVAPAGLVENDSIMDMVMRAYVEHKNWRKVKKKVDRDDRKQWKVADGETWKCWRSNPRNMLKEAGAIAKTPIGEVLKKLQGDYGIGIAILAPKDDKLCPIADRIEEVSTFTEVPEKHIYEMPDKTHVPHIEDPLNFALSADLALHELAKE